MNHHGCLQTHHVQGTKVWATYGKGLDSGAVGLDSGAVGLDSGAGAVGLDSGAVGLDSGAVGLDSGAVGLDSGVVGLDSGAVCLDSGSVGLENGAVCSCTCTTCQAIKPITKSVAIYRKKKQFGEKKIKRRFSRHMSANYIRCEIMTKYCLQNQFRTALVVFKHAY